MKAILNFILYTLYVVFGCFTIMLIGYYFNLPVLISYIIGGIWGYIVAIDRTKRFK